MQFVCSDCLIRKKGGYPSRDFINIFQGRIRYVEQSIYMIFLCMVKGSFCQLHSLRGGYKRPFHAYLDLRQVTRIVLKLHTSALVWVPNPSSFLAWYHWQAPLQVQQLKVQSHPPRTTSSPGCWVCCLSQLSSHPAPPSPRQTSAVKHQLNTACRVLRVINFSKILKEQKPWKRLLMPFTLWELLGSEIVILTLGWILREMRVTSSFLN